MKPILTALAMIAALGATVHAQYYYGYPPPPSAPYYAPYPYAPRGYYRNNDDVLVPRPYMAPSPPVGSTAQCRDGTFSFSQHRSGTCSHHGGVAY